jgi:hypothetical protein
LTYSQLQGCLHVVCCKVAQHGLQLLLLLALALAMMLRLR